ncbi:OmpH family outer membrane protein [Rhodovulum sp. 12E13]|uniref:OmpH family outer membrane protein n=1 Tax=Rhodovulum sp. 12E13 TaxID=2203891 RepID=UPI000E17A510|nr:OmpH family outer membrane protein [Rhodovulum sp. 12E13]RDC73358.1 OmpH family outer membrane protein [Rhodovulum sp. 12E13]
MRGRALILAALAAAPAQAQQGDSGMSGLVPAQGRGFPEFPVARPQAPVLTLDQERLFAQSEFGQRVLAEIDAASKALAAENREIEAELLAEERELTELRAELPADEFQARAQAFDDRAVGFRRQQDAKARALQGRDEAERAAFFRAVSPILSELVAELGAVAILDDRAVLFAAPAIDVTDRAIARVDARIGAGEALSPEGPMVPENPPVEPAMELDDAEGDDGDSAGPGLVPGGAGPETGAAQGAGD